MAGESKQDIGMSKSLEIAKCPLLDVKHMKNTSKLSPKKHTTWKEFWEIVNSPLTFPDERKACACCGEPTDPKNFVGAHIYEVSSKDMYIYPLCCSCNGKYGEGKEESPIFKAKTASCARFNFSDCEEEPEHPEECFWEPQTDALAHI